MKTKDFIRNQFCIRCQDTVKNTSTPDSDLQSSVSSLRVRNNGDKLQIYGKHSILQDFLSFSLDVKKTSKIHRPRILTRSVRFPPFGFSTTEINPIRLKTQHFIRNIFSLDVKKVLKIHRPRILTRSVRFPPFGSATTEISSNSIENIPF